MSTATINTSSLPQLTDLVTRGFLAAPTMPLDNVMLNSGIVRKETIGMNTGGVRRFAQTVVRTPYSGQGSEGAPATQAVFQYGYEKDLFIEKHDLAISITLEMRSLGKDTQIISELSNLWPTGYREIDLDLAHRLTFGWSTSYTNSRGVSKDITCGDGLALISTVHTLTGSANTFSNQVPNNPQFSKGALTAAKKLAVENTYDNLGNKLGIDYNTIISSDDESTVIAIKELINATADITSANANTYNAYGKSYLKHTIAPRIATKISGSAVSVDTTKAKYWFLAASDAKPLIYGEVMAPSVVSPREGNNGEDASTGNWNWYLRALWGVACASPVGLIGSKGDGTV